MVRIWDPGVYGLVYHGREVDLSDKVDYVTSETKIIIFRNRGGALPGLEVLRKHGFDRFEEWIIAEKTETEMKQCLQELAQEDDIVVLLTTRRQQNRWQEELDHLGVRWQLFQLVVAFFEGMLPRYWQVHDMLEDEASRQTYTDVLSYRFKLQPKKEISEIYCDNQYFAVPEMLTFSENDVFVDCGAFVGDTVESYLNHCQGLFHKIIAFEPGPVQFKAMKERFQRLRREWAIPSENLECICAGVGSRSSHASLAEDEITHHIIGAHLVDMDSEKIADGNAVAIVALDEALKDQCVGFIKADIEGYEMDMLHGAEHLIRTQHPRMAICLYHKLMDYYEIPLYLHELVPEYHFKVRHHSMRLTETVLYAYCDE